MAVDDFLRTYQQSLMNKKTVNPLSVSNTKPPVAQQSFGATVPDWIKSRKSNALESYMANKSEKTTDLAQKYTDMAAGQVPVNEYGIVQNKTTDFSDYFNKQLGAVSDYGKSALATEEAKARWTSLQNQAELNAGYNINWTPGASGNNMGAKAVSIAMNAANNHTPYAWGGNSLTTGVDCSGLVQQVYKQLGIAVPRTTYEQAKNGKVVNMSSILPGDLIFYNTGSSDPNGIGSLSHVGIYIGNGKIIHAPGRGKTVTISTISNPGTPARAVRPW